MTGNSGVKFNGTGHEKFKWDNGNTKEIISTAYHLHSKLLFVFLTCVITDESIPFILTFTLFRENQSQTCFSLVTSWLVLVSTQQSNMWGNGLQIYRLILLPAACEVPINT